MNICLVLVMYAYGLYAWNTTRDEYVCDHPQARRSFFETRVDDCWQLF